MTPCCKGPIEGTFILAQMTDKIWTENTVFRILNFGSNFFKQVY